MRTRSIDIDDADDVVKTKVTSHFAAPYKAWEVDHEDGRRFRIYIRAWRVGEDPREEGNI